MLWRKGGDLDAGIPLHSGPPVSNESLLLEEGCGGKESNTSLPFITFSFFFLQYLFDCDKMSTLPTVTFQLDGKAYPLTPKEYILQVRERETLMKDL